MALAAKSLITRNRLSPKCLRTASIENVHGWFVSVTWSPVIGDAIANKPIHVLDIPDEYQYMDPELVDLLKASVESILGLP